MSKNQLQVLVDEIVEHLKVVSSLKSFEQVQMWDSKSKDYIETIQYQLSVLTQQLHELSLKYKDQSLEFQNLGFLKKIGKKDPSIETLSSINTYNESISILSKLRDGLEEWIDVTPDVSQ